MSKCKTCDRHWVDLSGGRCTVCLLAEVAKLKQKLEGRIEEQDATIAKLEVGIQAMGEELKMQINYGAILYARLYEVSGYLCPIVVELADNVTKKTATIAKLKEAARDYMANGCDDHDALAKLLEEVCDE